MRGELEDLKQPSDTPRKGPAGERTKLLLRSNCMGFNEMSTGVGAIRMLRAFKTDSRQIPSRLNSHIKKSELEIEFKWSMTSKVRVKKGEDPKEVGEGNRVYRREKLRGHISEHYTKLKDQAPYLSCSSLWL